MNSNDITKTTEIFASHAAYDTRHVLNLKSTPVPEDLLRKIEAGCPLEALEEATATLGLPICKYATQITIHGLFPETHTRRIGGYVNLIRNQNQSIGVRWNAVDYEKKSRLFRILSVCNGWHVMHDSRSYRAEKLLILRENAEEKLAALRAEAERIDTSLFYGGARVVTGYIFMAPVALLTLNINGFYERDFDRIAQNVTGLTAAEIAEKMAAHEAKCAAEKAERDRRIAEYDAKRKQEAAELKAANEKWLAENPAPFPLRENYTLQPGDVYAVPESEDRYSFRARPYHHWQTYLVRKAFGRLTRVTCDADGKPGMRSGREIAQPTGNFHVKAKAPVAAPVRPAVTAPAPKAAPAAPAPVTGVTVTENTAKNGIEIRFPAKPSAAVLASLKSHGWRWTRFGGCWYNRATAENRAFAASLCA